MHNLNADLNATLLQKLLCIFVARVEKNTYLCNCKTETTLHSASPDGGIGRRAGLKHRWSNPSRFDPGSGY